MDEQLAEIKELFEDADISIIKTIVYFDGWSDWEECGGILVFIGIDDSIQVCHYGECVMAEDNTDYFEPIEVTQEYADKLIEEMKETIKNEM